MVVEPVIGADAMRETAWNVRSLEQGLLVNRGELFRLGTAILFIVLIMLFALARGPEGPNGGPVW